MSDPKGPSPAVVARSFALLVILVEAVGILRGGRLPETAAVASSLHVVFFVHVWVTLYDGIFGRWRTVTWLLLLIGWLAIVLADFFAFVMPWGQLGFWLAARIAWVPHVHLEMPSWRWVRCFLQGMLLAADLLAMHGGWWRRFLRPRPYRGRAWFGATMLLTAALLISLGLDQLTSHHAPAGSDAAFPIVPPWYVLPLYAVLRAPAWKGAGVALMFAVASMPAVWPWAGAARIRVGRHGRLYAVLCVGLGLDIVALGCLGSVAPDLSVRFASASLVAAYLAFFGVCFVLRDRRAQG